MSTKRIDDAIERLRAACESVEAWYVEFQVRWELDRDLDSDDPGGADRQLTAEEEEACYGARWLLAMIERGEAHETAHELQTMIKAGEDRADVEATSGAHEFDFIRGHGFGPCQNGDLDRLVGAVGVAFAEVSQEISPRPTRFERDPIDGD